MRRRLRERRRAREAMLLDLGALVYELHRHGKRAPELLQRKAAELTVVDDEVRELEDALAGREPERREDEPEPPEDEAQPPEDEAQPPEEVEAAEAESGPELAEEARS
jgi:hypothetical protein